MHKTVLAALPLMMTFALMACDSTPADAPEVEDAPILLKAGEWAMSWKTTGYNTPTVTPAEYQKALKETKEDKICIAVDAKGVPDADALAGSEGKDCTFKDQMLRKGRLIATMECKSGAGTSEIVIDGNYTADTLTLGSTTTRTVDGHPVMRTTHDLTGKRAGDCPRS